MATRTGTAGSDTLYGGGPDTLVGLQGDDTYVVYSQNDLVTEQANEGSDTVYAFASYTLAADVSVEFLSTAVNSDTAAINLGGNALAQQIVGNYGANILNGYGGNDTLIGLRGDDIYRIYAQGDVVIEGAGDGNDTIYTSANYQLAAGVSVETLSTAAQGGTEALFLVGNEISQRLIGNYGANTLNGNGGNDTLIGLRGDDIYRVYGSGDLVIENPDEGNDTIYTSASYALTGLASIETLSTAAQGETQAINLVGNAFAQRLIGNYGSNVLNGNGGVDTLIGLLGDDTYVVGNAASVIVENSGEGNDTVYAGVSYRLAAGVSVETLSAQVQAGTTLLNLAGNEFAQTIVGNNGTNILDGGAGADVLIGLGGADTFYFSTALGTGNVDTIADYGNGNDVVLMDPGVFSGLASGAVAASAIAIGNAAADADDRIIYNPSSGALSYDSDGTGNAAAIQFAVLPAGLGQNQLNLQVGSALTGTVRITGGGAYAVGGATQGISLDATYPDATGYLFDAGGQQNFYQLAFGPRSYAPGHPTISYNPNDFPFTSLDFSALGTGLVVRTGGDFQTAAGANIVTLTTSNGSFLQLPRTIVGTPFDDVIDRSDTERSAGGGLGSGPYGTIVGGAGNDTLISGAAQDGGDGDDRLVAAISIIGSTYLGFGTQMTGGAGSDTFVIADQTRMPGTNSRSSPNTLTDFTPGVDRIELIVHQGDGLSVGALDPSRFHVGSAATTPDQRIIYNPDTGELIFDLTGSLQEQPGDYRVFAMLPAHLDLTAASFTIVFPGP